MSMEQLSNVQYPDVLDNFPDATHIVTRIGYGGSVVISFEKTVEHYSYKHEAAEN